MTNVLNLGISSIDSFKLRIELSNLTAYDKTLLDTLTVSNPSGEIESEFKRKAKQYHFDGYSFYASISEGVRVSQNRFADCLIILINSKQIECNYFDGITIDTIKIVYKKVVEAGIFDCDLDTLLKHGYPTDIDFKKDYRLPLPDYKELIKVCRVMTKQSNNRDKGCTTFNKIGLAWSVRKTSKYLTNPYLKIYHKEIELKENSTEFADLYLTAIDFTNVFRIETTVKNRTHLRALKLGLKDFNLDSLLRLTTEQKNSILSQSVNSHLNPRTRSLAFKKQSNLTPTKQQQLNALLVFTSELNYSLDRSIKVLLNGIENKTSKSLNKTTLKQLYSDHIKGTDYDSKTSKIDSVFDSFGWF